MKFAASAMLTAAIVAASTPAAAQTVEQFYKGKQIELAIGYPPAGSNDVYARAAGPPYRQAHPRQSDVVPQNLPGAGSFLTLAYVYGVAPKDGTVIGIGAPTAPLDEKLGTQGVRFKTAEFNWIGRIDSLINMVFLWHTSPVKTVADALKIGIEIVRHRRRLHRVDLSDRDEQRARHQVQADHGLQGLERSAACGRARRGRGPFHVVDRGEGRASGLAAGQEDQRHRAVFAEETPGIAGCSDRGRARPQRRGAPGAQRRGERRRNRHGVLHHARRPAGPRRRAAPRLRRHHEGSGISGRSRASTKLTVGPLPGEELQKLVAEVAAISPSILEKVRAAYAAPK